VVLHPPAIAALVLAGHNHPGHLEQVFCFHTMELHQAASDGWEHGAVEGHFDVLPYPGLVASNQGHCHRACAKNGGKGAGRR
jgi:hypothetical protein